MGWASAPYDPLWAERHPQRAAIMAAAGPAGNFMLALVAFAGLRGGLLAGLFVPPERAAFHALVADASTGDPNFLGTVLSVFLVLNVFIGLFNLIPLPPLDGFSVVSIFLPEEHAAKWRALQSNPVMSMAGLLIAWRVFPSITGELFTMLLKVVHPGELYS
jgi:Zn-dependent protease